MIIRTETLLDAEIITQITKAAFADRSYSSGTEHLIIKQLRKAGALALSLIAQSDAHIVGHIAFSVVTIDDADLGWYGLGPISVLPAWQRQGVGSALIDAGLADLRVMGGQGCVVEGDFRYYRRFGFETYPHLIYDEAPAPEYFMALPFYDEVPKGKVEYHEAFRLNDADDDN